MEKIWPIGDAQDREPSFLFGDRKKGKKDFVNLVESGSEMRVNHGMARKKKKGKRKLGGGKKKRKGEMEEGEINGTRKTREDMEYGKEELGGEEKRNI